MDNLITKIYNESTEGILICGINWSGTLKTSEIIEKDPETYFSDTNAYYWLFRNKLLKWFKLWGHELKENLNEIDKYEKSISYTNWLVSKSPHITDVYTKCKDDHTCIFNILEFLKPRLIFFLSNELLKALNSPECIKKANTIFGKNDEAKYIQHDILFEEKKLRKFKIGFQSFQKCNIVSLPHPTGSRRLNDEYITSFKDEIGQIISEWKMRF